MTKQEKYEKFDEMVRRESKKPEGDLYCPNCGSHRLHYYLGSKTGQIYVCKFCGYHGPLVIEDGKLADKISQDWLKRNEQNGT